MKKRNQHNTYNLSNEEIQRRERVKQELVMDRDFTCWQVDAIEEDEDALGMLQSVFPDKTNYWDLDDFDLAHMRYDVIPRLDMED